MHTLFTQGVYLSLLSSNTHFAGSAWPGNCCCHSGQLNHGGMAWGCEESLSAAVWHAMKQASHSGSQGHASIAWSLLLLTALWHSDSMLSWVLTGRLRQANHSISQSREGSNVRQLLKALQSESCSSKNPLSCTQKHWRAVKTWEFFRMKF